MLYRFRTTASLAAFAMAALPMAVQAQSQTSTQTAGTASSLNPVVVTAALAPRTANEAVIEIRTARDATVLTHGKVVVRKGMALTLSRPFRSSARRPA